jgi:hypothetical protein
MDHILYFSYAEEMQRLLRRSSIHFLWPFTQDFLRSYDDPSTRITDPNIARLTE